MKYLPVIGLEIHVELNTKSKMFCGCSADYWKAEPNTHTCPVCLGLPGALPFANKIALESCIKIGLALGCTINSESRFERKNYFYPDLPKGYQISQYRWPLCVAGSWQLAAGQLIRINRVHQEEDTAKLVHQLGISNDQFPISNGGKASGIDFNRSGVPLVEIVTEPDFDNIEDVVEFAKSFQQIVKDLGVSNADMERGDLRLEANISVRPEGQTDLPDYRIELKNINSFRFMAHALDYEIKRQTELLGQGVTLSQETRGWNEDKKESYLQRSKEEAHDYRYFPEPDIPEFSFSQEEVEKIKSKMGELGSEKAKRLVIDYGISQTASEVLLTQGKADYFEEAVKDANNQITAHDIANAIVNKRIPTDLKPREFIGKLSGIKGKVGIEDSLLEKAVDDAISENPKQAQDYIGGKENILQFLIGQVMAKTKGQADPNRARQMLIEKVR